MTPDGALDDAFAAAPRRHFLPRAERRSAAADRPLPIGWGQTNSQPRTVRTMLALLDVRPGHRVLDVGSGSAWTTALLAHLVGVAGSVLGVEIVPELVASGRRALAGLDLPQARIEQAEDDVLGWPAEAPYDRVLVSAQAGDVPWVLADQLAAGGVMVVPVSGILMELRAEAGGPRVVKHGHYSFVPLIGG